MQCIVRKYWSRFHYPEQELLIQMELLSSWISSQCDLFRNRYGMLKARNWQNIPMSGEFIWESGFSEEKKNKRSVQESALGKCIHFWNSIRICSSPNDITNCYFTNYNQQSKVNEMKDLNCFHLAHISKSNWDKILESISINLCFQYIRDKIPILHQINICSFTFFYVCKSYK